MHGIVRSDRFVGIGALVVSIPLFLELLSNEPRTMGMSAISSRTFPLVAVALLALFGLLLTVKDLLRSRRRSAAADPAAADEPPLVNRTIAGFLLATVLYVVLLRQLGFYPVSAVYLALTLLWLSGWRRWPQALLITAVAIGLFYGVFSLWLGLLLPRGTIW